MRDFFIEEVSHAIFLLFLLSYKKELLSQLIATVSRCIIFLKKKIFVEIEEILRGISLQFKKLCNLSYLNPKIAYRRTSWYGEDFTTKAPYS